MAMPRTHFRDDPILAYFSVDHVEQLLALYDRELSFTIQRTDPPPGSAARYGPVGMSPNYGALPIAMMNPADARFVEAAAALPCVDLPAMGGTTAALGGDVLLEPRAHYDLRLAATSTTIGVADITRQRHQLPGVALRVTGRPARGPGLHPGPTDVPSPVLPYDAIVATEPPRGAASFVTGDAAFDATLADLGLDPWPLAAARRASWRCGAPAGAEWSFEGLLIEADEAIVRPGRLAVDTISVGPAAGPAIALDVVRLSSSGARILATPAASASLTAEEVLTVALASTTTGADGVSSTVTVTGSPPHHRPPPPRLPGAHMSEGFDPRVRDPGRRRLRSGSGAGGDVERPSPGVGDGGAGPRRPRSDCTCATVSTCA